MIPLFLLGCGIQGAVDPCPTERLVVPTPGLQEDIIDGAPAAPTGAVPAGDRPLRFVWLLDHSGSMYPGYAPGQPRAGTPWYVESPPFRDFVTRTLGGTFRDGTDRAQIVLFNEEAWLWNGEAATKPAAYDEGAVADRDALAARFASIPPPPYGVSVRGLPAPVKGANDCSVRGAGPNCSRMAAGLDAAVALLAEGAGEGIIWLVTDNIYEGRSAGAGGLGDAELESNATFYQRLHDDPLLQMVYAWPVRQPAGAGWMKDSSLFVYGIYYSKHGRPPLAELRRLGGEDGSAGGLSSPDLVTAMRAFASPESPSPGQPFRLKPLDADLVRIRLASELESAGGGEFKQDIPVLARLEVENMLAHRRIDRITFAVRNGKWIGYDASDGALVNTVRPLCPGAFGKEGVTIGPIEPGAKASVDVTFAMPGVQTEFHTLGDLFQLAGNDRVIMGGSLYAVLSELRTSLAIPEADLQGIYGVEALPGIFANPRDTPYTSLFTGQTRPIENPGAITALFALAGMVAAALIAAAGLFLMRRVGRELVVDGVSCGQVLVGRILPLRVEHRGRQIASARLSLGGIVGVSAARGSRVKPEPRGWTVTTSEGEDVRVELRTLGRR